MRLRMPQYPWIFRYSGGRRRKQILILFTIICLLYGLLVWRFWFVSDDAFISFRYAKNWVEGNGLRYNLGELPPVEGYSNFLWVVVCAVIELFRGDPTFWVPLLSVGCGALLLTSIHHSLRSRLGFGSEVSLFVTLSLALFPPFAVWSTGGLETLPFALTLFLVFDRMVLREVPAPVSSGLIALAMSLMRIEGICWAIFVGLLTLLSRGRDRASRRSLAIYFSFILVGYGLYFTGRYAYYELLFPNPVYLKVGFGTDVLLRGYRYVAMFFLIFLTPFLILPGAAVALVRGPLRLSMATVTMALAVPAYAVMVGGDWMIMGRFLVPGFAFQTLLFGWLLQSIWGSGWLRRVSTVALVLASIGVALLPAWNIQLVPRSVRIKYRYMYSHPGFRTEYEEWQLQKKGVTESKEVGLALKSHARPGSSLVAGGIGALGYYSDLFVYDRFGLVSPEVVEWAKREGRWGPLGSPGHDVFVSRAQFFKVWKHSFSRRLPTYLLFEVIESRNIKSSVLEQVEEWRTIGSLWQRYSPDFIVLDGKSVSETHRVLLVFSAIEDEADGGLDRLKRAKAVWQDFYARAAKLAHRWSSPRRQSPLTKDQEAFISLSSPLGHRDSWGDSWYR